MLSRSLVLVRVVLYPAFVIAQSLNSLVCVSSQCLEGLSDMTIGETLSAQGYDSVHLLPGQYTSSTNPQLLQIITSSPGNLSQSPGFNLPSVNPLPFTIALQPGLVIYSNPLYTGNANLLPLPSTPLNSSLPLPASSLALSDNVWIALTSGTANNTIIFWDAFPDVSQLPPEASQDLALVDFQLSTCVPPCSGSGVCSTSGSCSCPTGFTGSLGTCEVCSKGFFGPNCQPCPSDCETCDQGISGSGLCLVPLVSNAPETCNCVNGQCGINGACACNTGWTDASNGTACAQCLEGFFLTATGDCRICQVGCSQCAPYTADCIACDEGFIQDSDDRSKCNPFQGVANGETPCSDGLYKNKQTCDPCSPSCQTCNGPSSNNCITCPPSTSLFQGSCVATSANGVCEGSNGMIADNVKQECDACGAKCTSCEIPNFNVASTVSQLQCTGCLAGFFLSQGQCVGNCPSGTFVSPQDNLTCTACSSACSTCLGSADYCLTCANEQLALSGQCVSSCLNGTFSSSGACRQCHPDCATCTGSSFNQCSTCSPNRPVLTSAGRCLPICSKSQFFDPTTSTCQDCDSSCSSCSDSGPNHCLACSSSTQVLLAGSCVSAKCTGSSDVVPGLGVCLSDLVQESPVPTSTTTTSPSSAPIGTIIPTESTPSSTGSTTPSVKDSWVTWWKILLIGLGGTFIILMIFVLWRMWVRKQRVEETVMFADARHLDGGDGRWHLRTRPYEREDYDEDIYTLRRNLRNISSMYEHEYPDEHAKPEWSRGTSHYY